jgi:Asp-tRNA(Asn)/Glu-tRNA(Gln) amidotransferase A subunit family amidase
LRCCSFSFGTGERNLSPDPGAARGLLEGHIDAFATALGEGRVDASELTEASLERLGARAGSNVVVELLSKVAPQPQEGPLWGVPVVVKDCFVDRGRPPTLGSRAPATWLDGTATVLDRLRSAGASLVGYSNLHEWMVGVTSVISAFGPVANPRDPALIAGGSSGGSAAAVAAGDVVAAIGTDAGGSIRIPAACCGIVGFKPSRGAVPDEGFVDQGSPVDHIGPLGRSVGDVVTVFEVLSGRPLELPRPEGLRVGLVRPFFLDDVDPDVRAATERVAGLLERVEEVEVRGVEEARGAIAPFILGDVFRMLEEHHRNWPELVQPHTLRVMELGRAVDDDARRWADGVRARLEDAWERVFERVDVVLTPTLPGRIASVKERTVSLPSGLTGAEGAYVAWNGPMNLGGVPSLSLPAGTLPDGQSFNASLTGARGNDDAVLGAGLLLESLLRA